MKSLTAIVFLALVAVAMSQVLVGSGLGWNGGWNGAWNGLNGWNRGYYGNGLGWGSGVYGAGLVNPWGVGSYAGPLGVWRK